MSRDISPTSRKTCSKSACSSTIPDNASPKSRSLPKCSSHKSKPTTSRTTSSANPKTRARSSCKSFTTCTLYQPLRTHCLLTSTSCPCSMTCHSTRKNLTPRLCKWGWATWVVLVISTVWSRHLTLFLRLGTSLCRPISIRLLWNSSKTFLRICTSLRDRIIRPKTFCSPLFRQSWRESSRTLQSF